jgi:hypothetical protein
MVKTHEPTAKASESTNDVPTLSAAVPAEDKVIGGPVGVPLAAAISPYGHREPQVDLMPQDTASGARFGLDDDAPLADVAEVPVGGSVNESPASWAWVPPSPRPALDPLTAPYEQLQRAETPSDSTDDENQKP